MHYFTPHRYHPPATPERTILWACNEGRIDIVATLLRQDPSLVRANDADGYTPLHRASYNANVALVKMLLAHGADPNARTLFGWTPVHSSCQWTHAECVAVLLQHGADVNARTHGDQTPLHIAASVSNCRPTAMTLLLSADVEPERENNSGETAATIARRTGLSYPLFEMGNSAFRCELGMIE